MFGCFSYVTMFSSIEEANNVCEKISSFQLELIYSLEFGLRFSSISICLQRHCWNNLFTKFIYLFSFVRTFYIGDECL